MNEKGRNKQRQLVFCPICGNENAEPRYNDRPYRCKWCKSLVDDWSGAEKAGKKEKQR
ncbi:MAG: hypothetical protein IJK60_05655 [Clostridia bacterium]|nr:hypothetical protein [Clostridia bacterium]